MLENEVLPPDKDATVLDKELTLLFSVDTVLDNEFTVLFNVDILLVLDVVLL